MKNIIYILIFFLWAIFTASPNLQAVEKVGGEKDMKPGSLVVQIGKLFYPAGKNITFRAESEGIFSLGPFEWDSYSYDSGYLLVTIKVSDN